MPYLGCARKMLVRKSDLRVNKDIMLGKLSKWLGRLSVGRKLMLIYLLDLTAVIYVSGILINEKFLSIDFARKEIAGVAYTEVVRHSLMSVFVPQGPNEAAAQASAVRLADIRRQHDEDLGTADMAEKFVQSLAKVNAHTGSAAGPAGQVWLRGGLLLDGRQLLTAVGNQSNLILDPDLDSYYVMSLSVLRFPELLQMLHDIQVFMLQPPGRSGSDHRTAELLTLAGRLDAVLWAMEADYNQAWVAGGPVLQRSLADSRQALLGQTRAFWLPCVTWRPPMPTVRPSPGPARNRPMPRWCRRWTWPGKPACRHSMACSSAGSMGCLPACGCTWARHWPCWAAF